MKPYYETELGKLYHGDCLEIMPELEPVDLVLTDPPYFSPVQHYVVSRGDTYPKRTLSDSAVLAGYFKHWANIADRAIMQNGTFYVFCDGQSYPFFYTALFPHCKHVRPLVWDKLVSYNGYTWRHQHELIAWGERSETERVPTGDGDILKHRGVRKKDKKHLAEKPVGLILSLINKHNHNLILDPFLGGGTTAIACERLNRRWIGIEIEEKYCEISAKRIEKERSQLKLF